MSIDLTAAFQKVLVLLCIPFAYVLFQIATSVYRSLTSPLRSLPLPSGSTDALDVIRDHAKIDALEEWVDALGDTFRVSGPLGIPLLFTIDQKAVHHIQVHAHTTYHKPPEGAKRLRLIGDGIIFADGDVHARQRKIMMPTFAPSQVRDLQDIFLEKSIQLRDALLSTVSSSGSTPINIIPWLGKATLDVIGRAGFDYDFRSFSPSPNEKPGAGNTELGTALNVVLSAPPPKPSILLKIANIFQNVPIIVRVLPRHKDSDVDRAMVSMRRIGHELIAQKKQAVLDASAGHTKVEADDIEGKDILSLLVKANMMTDLPADKRLTDQDVLAQIPTFIVAGHETSSTATTWTLFALAANPAIQRTLREECLSVGTDAPTSETLDKLPYLDAVVRESLRLYAPVPMIARYAVQDDVIPLANPYIDVKGQKRDNVHVQRGDRLLMPLLLTNRLKKIWGPDAHEFKPERWESLPESAHNISAVWGNMATFGGGPRACIGFRFAIMEVKSLLFSLITSLEFTLPFDPSEVRPRGDVVQRPHLASRMEEGPQMPLLIRPYKA